MKKKSKLAAKAAVSPAQTAGLKLRLRQVLEQAQVAQAVAKDAKEKLKRAKKLAKVTRKEAKRLRKAAKQVQEEIRQGGQAHEAGSGETPAEDPKGRQGGPAAGNARAFARSHAAHAGGPCRESGESRAGVRQPGVRGRS
jgi:hypothetical protein